MSAGALDQMAEHLQFLGYEIAREGELIFARHPRKFNIVMKLVGGGILIASFFTCTDEAKRDRSGYLEMINTLNARAVLARFYADEDSDLRMEAWHPNAYDRHTFSAFMELWDHDSGLLLEAPQVERYLK
jgi:hypothetical protein